jgi:hypothetical protein
MLTASNASSTCERLAKEAAGSRLGIEVALAYGPFRPEARRCGPLLLQLLDRAGRRLIERVQRESAQTIASGLLVRHVSIPLHSGVGLGEELALDQMQAVQANNPASASARFILVAVSPPVLDISPTDTETPLAPRLQPGQDIGNEPVHIEAGKTPPPTTTALASVSPMSKKTARPRLFALCFTHTPSQRTRWRGTASRNPPVRQPTPVG